MTQQPSKGPSIYSFPKDLLENPETKHYILFEIYDDEAASVTTTKRSITLRNTEAEQWTNRVRNERNYGNIETNRLAEVTREFVSGLQSGETGDAQRYEGVLTDVTSVISKSTSSTRFTRANTRSSDSIVLPLPQALDLSDGWDWEMVGFKKNILGNAISTALSSFEGAGETIQQSMSLLLGRVANSGIENADRLFEAQTRSAFNPRKEMLFNEPTNRTINLQYDFVPRNDFEARAIKDIMDLFKFYASPDRKSDRSIIYKYPAEFQIYFISNDQENPFIAKLARVALTSIETNYMGSGVVSMLKNNSPSRIKVTMGFSETELLDRRHYFGKDEVDLVTQEGA